MVRSQVAYRVAGSGPVLMLGFNGLATIEAVWEEPRFESSFSGRVSVAAGYLGHTPAELLRTYAPLPADHDRAPVGALTC